MEPFTNPKMTRDAVRRGIRTARGNLHDVIDNVADKSVPVFRQVSGRARDAAHKVADGAHHAADAIYHKGEQLNSLQQQLVAGTRNTIRNRPLLAVGIAVASGVLLSWWLSRRQKQQQDIEDVE
ncbi:hypothetical protein [Arsukibacterium sp.]|uniref:hypothetical protein n=1 Tax=Arsukibacterium sp. TaxID=1977258 RepID=UPI00299D88DA|nr:hypothetical protein [Arsukibacterium sp.]MDX1678425.1 hypothetical protein [Arsukibacterium sp.]